MPRNQITPPLILVHPNTYHCKEQICALGGKWKPEYKGWELPSQAAYNQAFELCDGVGKDKDNRYKYFSVWDNSDWLDQFIDDKK